MSSRKKCLLAVALLVMICMPLSLFLYWKAQQFVVHHEMKEKLGQARLVTIEIPAASVQWHQHEKEIIVQGKLFDVKYFKQIPGTINISFTGLFDEAETEIEDKVRKLLRQKEKKDAGVKLLVQSIWLFSCPFPEPPSLYAFNPLFQTTYNPGRSIHFSVPDIAIPAPPPKA